MLLSPKSGIKSETQLFENHKSSRTLCRQGISSSVPAGTFLWWKRRWSFSKGWCSIQTYCTTPLTCLVPFPRYHGKYSQICLLARWLRQWIVLPSYSGYKDYPIRLSLICQTWWSSKACTTYCRSVERIPSAPRDLYFEIEAIVHLIESAVKRCWHWSSRIVSMKGASSFFCNGCIGPIRSFNS